MGEGVALGCFLSGWFCRFGGTVSLPLLSQTEDALSPAMLLYFSFPTRSLPSYSRAPWDLHACGMRICVPGLECRRMHAPPCTRARAHMHTYNERLQEEGPARQLCV